MRRELRSKGDSEAGDDRLSKPHDVSSFADDPSTRTPQRGSFKFPPGMLPPEVEPQKQPIYAAFAAVYGAATLIFSPVPALLAIACLGLGVVAGGLRLLDEELAKFVSGVLVTSVPLMLAAPLINAGSPIFWQPYAIASSAMILTYFAPEALSYGRRLWSRLRATSPPASDA